MRESLMYGSVRGARGNSRPYRDAREDRCGSFASKAAEAVRPCTSAALPKADVNSTPWPPTLCAIALNRYAIASGPGRRQTLSPGERWWVAGEAPCLEDRGVLNLTQDRSCQ